VVFDAAKISDRSTYAKPMEPSVGVRYLLVGGTILVDEGKIAPNVFPAAHFAGRGRSDERALATLMRSILLRTALLFVYC